MSSKHGRRHNVRHAKLGKAYRPGLDAAMLRRLAWQTGKVTSRFNALGQVWLRFKLNMEAFSRELRKTLEATRPG